MFSGRKVARLPTTPTTTVRWVRSTPVNPQVAAAQYAVRGKLLDRAMEIERELKDPVLRRRWPFDEVVRCNVGNPQALGQQPPRFSRQVLSLLMNPELEEVASFSEEAKGRARLYRDAMVGGLGAYSDSKGLDIVRREVATFIEARDGYPCDPEDVHLSDGASAAVMRTLKLLLTPQEDALLVPYPQYPLYTALVTLCDGTAAPYYPDEREEWSITERSLEEAFERAIQKEKNNGTTPRALVCINPGNPTGASLRRESLETVVDFCRRKKIALLADEVYQENVYAGPPFISLRKVVRDLRADDVPLFSFHSISKGFTGECGLRGGYVELTNVDDDAKRNLTKLASISLCSNVPGQVAVGLMVHPPQSPAEAAYYRAEKKDILDGLKRRSELMADALDRLPGISCPRAHGALYVFPSIALPPRALAAANKRGLAPDAFYSVRLLEATGLLTVPGAGFGQKNGTFHFRTSFLPPEKQISKVLDRLEAFHRAFLDDFNEPRVEDHDDDDRKNTTKDDPLFLAPGTPATKLLLTQRPQAKLLKPQPQAKLLKQGKKPNAARAAV
mmetsp:Transcript_7484/g.24709  ORF Transcript_7484/g.24709 Transcript_7484/m.24709 type:complete len:560 (+) Transcript_7484:41-1720(+)